MTPGFRRILALDPPPSPALVPGAGAGPRVRIGLVQHAWHPDVAILTGALTDAIGMAADAGARLVVLPELTLSRYPADTVPTGRADAVAESLVDGPTVRFAAAAAATHGVLVHASLYERTGDADGRGLNVAIVVSPDGEVVVRTPKLHLPVTAGYHEDLYFRPGPAEGADPALGPYPVHRLGGTTGAARRTGPAGGSEDVGGTEDAGGAEDAGACFGFPTCWDEWFPEVARAYALGGADVVVYPSAIGSEPDHPDFDTEPLWRQVIVGNGIANGLFMVVANRTGQEPRPDGTPGHTFYGSSFVSDPYGRVLVQAPGTSRRCSWSTSTCVSARTGSTCSHSCARGDPTRTAHSWRPSIRACRRDLDGAWTHCLTQQQPARGPFSVTS